MTPNRQTELETLAAAYGTPVRRSVALDVGENNLSWWSTIKARRRDGEVVLFIRRPSGNLILHSKDFYPAGVFRVPSGGIKRGEPVLDAVCREVREETGLEVAVEQFLAFVEFEFHHAGDVVLYPSYAFLLRESAGELRVMDLQERISAFREAPFTALAAVARDLERVPPDWQTWGEFRALPHRLVAELLG